MLGYSQEEFVGMSVTTLHPPEELGRVRDEMQKGLSGENRLKDLTCQRKDGSSLLVDLTGMPMQYQGRLCGIAIFRDITERREAEKQLQQRGEELEEAVRELQNVNRELEAFSYSVSHDLRAPLRAIEGFSRMLKEKQGAQLDAEGNRLLDVILGNTAHMGELIEDLLALSRTGRQELRTVPLDMKELASEVCEELRTEHPDRELEFRVGELPAARGDRTLTRQVLVNLVSNSVKFTAGEEKAAIFVGSGGKDKGNNVYFVKDNGAGFDMRYSDRLFAVFQRLHSTDDFEGTGVGLAIVQRIVHRHGGQVWAEGEVGRGATFYFTLPDVD